MTTLIPKRSTLVTPGLLVQEGFPIFSNRVRKKYADAGTVTRAMPMAKQIQKVD